jgi:decaprenyl-phosphate phosphoribosyltransferase
MSNNETMTKPTSQIANYIAIARPDHWFKNVFMLPGIALAFTLSNAPLSQALIINILAAIISTCLIASANYTINEWLDAGFDKFHPVKCNRPSVSGNLTAFWVYTQWFLLSVLGLIIAYQLGLHFLTYSAALLIMGILYNVKPIRTKDRIYLDVLSESINNPLRFMLGWTAVISNIIPPLIRIICILDGRSIFNGYKKIF